MKITFTFGSEEIDCEEVLYELGLETGRDEQEKITTTYELKDEDIMRLEELKTLKMEDLCRQFFNNTLAEETVAVHWEIK